MKYKWYVLALILVASGRAYSGEFVTTEPNDASYQYVSNYKIEIDASPDTVWNHLIDLKSWMYEFEMSHVSGDPGQVGEVLRLYPNQNFLIQITGKVKNQVLTISNLPSTMGGEDSTGVGLITMDSIEGKTVVNLVMSRRYTWNGDGVNAMKMKRSSTEFQGGTAMTWNKFLQKLKELSEQT